MSITAAAQKAYTDSLETVLAATKDPSQRLKLLSELGSVYLKSKPERAYDYAKQALELAQKAGNRTTQAGAHTSIGNCYYLKGNYPEALKSYLAAGKIMESWAIRKG